MRGAGAIAGRWNGDRFPCDHKARVGFSERLSLAEGGRDFSEIPDGDRFSSNRARLMLSGGGKGKGSEESACSEKAEMKLSIGERGTIGVAPSWLMI